MVPSLEPGYPKAYEYGKMDAHDDYINADSRTPRNPRSDRN